MSFEHLPSTGAGSATAGRVVRASWGELVRLALVDIDARTIDLEATIGGEWRGAWDADTDYNAGDIVQHNGSSYRTSVAIPVESPADEPGSSPSDWVLIAAGASSTIRTFGITIDGGGSAITTGLKGYVRVPYSGTIVRWTALSTDSAASPISASIVVDVLKGVIGGFPPTSSIAGSDKPTLTNDQEAESTALTGWTTTVTAGDIFGFEVESTSSEFTRVTVQVDVEASL
jgi:hypothetical protein